GRHDGYVWRVLERRDGTIVSAGRDGTLRSGHEILYQTNDGSITALAEDPRSRLWLGHRSGTLRCPEMSLDIPCGAAILDLAALACGTVAAALASGDLLLATDHAPVTRIPAHSGWAWSLAQTPAALFSAGEDGALRMHRLPAP